MVRPNPGAEGSDAPPPHPQQPEPAGHTAGNGGQGVQADELRHHPVVLQLQAQRIHNFQLRVADWITAFAGSTYFIYLHVALFTIWMLFIERSPWPTLTLIVSLEAIFLSTFVLIGQNRQAAFQQAKADHDFTEQELELKTNTQLTREIHRLTAELLERYLQDPARPQP